jgi:hypothetical protein
MADNESVVALSLCLHGVADYFSRTAKLNNGVGVRVVGTYALNVDLGTFVHDCVQVLTQMLPIYRAMFFIDVTLVPDFHSTAPCGGMNSIAHPSLCAGRHV